MKSPADSESPCRFSTISRSRVRSPFEKKQYDCLPFHFLHWRKIPNLGWPTNHKDILARPLSSGGRSSVPSTPSILKYATSLSVSKNHCFAGGARKKC